MGISVDYLEDIALDHTMRRKIVKKKSTDSEKSFSLIAGSKAYQSKNGWFLYLQNKCYLYLHYMWMGMSIQIMALLSHEKSLYEINFICFIIEGGHLCDQ